MCATEWDPAKLLDINNCDIKFALLVLNQPIVSSTQLVLSLWQRAAIRLTVDGGTDRWLKFLQSCSPEIDFIPEIVTGDLDSISPSALQQCSEKGATIIKNPDQNSTDFTKALKETAKWQEQNNVKLDAVVALVETAGRLDHILANLNTLFLAHSYLACPVYQLASNSISWLLHPGNHNIFISSSDFAKGHCGLIPVGAPSSCVTTTGLKWNLDKQRMQFGELISTSNALDNTEDGVITVTTDSTLLWTLQLPPKPM